MAAPVGRFNFGNPSTRSTVEWIHINGQSVSKKRIEELLNSVSHFGVEGLRKVRGTFSGAIVNWQARRLYVFRDPIGKKPLYTAEAKESLLLGTSVLELVAAGARDTSLDPGCISELWQRGHARANHCFIRGVRPVLPGQVLIFDLEGKYIGQENCAPSVEVESPSLRLDELDKKLGQLLQTAVQRRLLDTSHPISLLSGGIDSTIVSSLVAKQSCSSAFTLRSFLPIDKEEIYARYAAWKIGVPLRTRAPKICRLGEDLAWALTLQDEPFATPGFFQIVFSIREAKKHGKVILTGDGADAVFLGHATPAYWIHSPNSRSPQHSPANIHVGPPTPEWMSSCGRASVNDDMMYAFNKWERASVPQGVELRFPFLDWDLLTFARALPPERLFVGNQTKGLLKRQLSTWPRWFTHRPKGYFKFRLNSAWRLVGYGGLRENILPEAIETFGELVPSELRCHPNQWRTANISNHFDDAWKLMVWSAFIGRLERALSSRG